MSRPRARRATALRAGLALGALAALGAALPAGPARAQLPELPLPLPLPSGDQPSEPPDPSTSPTPDPGRSAPPSVPPPTWAPSEPPVTMEVPSTAPIGALPAPGPTAAPPVTVEAAPATVPPSVGTADPVAAALPGALALGLAGILAMGGLGSGMLAMTKRGLFSARAEHGGVDVEATKRWRLLGGLALLAAAAVVGVVGWLKISLETLVAVQIVYLASTGFAVIVLAAAGGSLLIAEQLRADERRLREVEDALLDLAGRIQPLVAAPPRTSGAAPGVRPFDPDVTSEIPRGTR